MTTYRASEPASAEDERCGSSAELRRFLVQLGGAMIAAGEAVNDIEQRLETIAGAYGAQHARVVVLPTWLEVALAPGEPTAMEGIRASGGTLRFDQVAAVYRLVEQAERGTIRPVSGIVALERIILSPARFGTGAVIAAHILLTVGLCLVLNPTGFDLAVAAGIGALVGIAQQIAVRFPTIQALLPAAAGFGVSLLVLTLARQGWADADLRVMIAPLVIFLPGSALTMGVIELAAGEIVAGASRLVSGAVQLLLLAFGIAAAAHIAGPASAEQLVKAPSGTIGWWGPWLAILIVTVGMIPYFSAPRGSFWWLLPVLYAAWIGRVLGVELFNIYVGGFVGALLMAAVAHLVARRQSGPPAFAAFLPGFMLLVPGSVSLIGLAKLADTYGTAGITDMFGAVGAILAIAFGIFCGRPFYRSGLTLLGRTRRLAGDSRRFLPAGALSRRTGPDGHSHSRRTLRCGAPNEETHHEPHDE